MPYRICSATDGSTDDRESSAVEECIGDDSSSAISVGHMDPRTEAEKQDQNSEVRWDYQGEAREAADQADASERQTNPSTKHCETSRFGETRKDDYPHPCEVCLEGGCV